MNFCNFLELVPEVRELVNDFYARYNAIRIALCIIDNRYLIRVVDYCTYLVVNSAAVYVLLN
jgi:hypothetical protein